MINNAKCITRKKRDIKAIFQGNTETTNCIKKGTERTGLFYLEITSDCTWTELFKNQLITIQMGFPDSLFPIQLTYMTQAERNQAADRIPFDKLISIYILI